MTGHGTEDSELDGRETDGWRSSEALVAVILGFWAVWWSLVFTTNLFEGMIRLDVLGEGWSFASGNYAFLVDVTAVHNTPEAVVAVLFAGGVAWELAVALLTWKAFAAHVREDAPSERHFYGAFVPAVGFFAAFLVLTEVFLAYDLAHTLVQLFVALLLTVLVVDGLRGRERRSV